MGLSTELAKDFFEHLQDEGFVDDQGFVLKLPKDASIFDGFPSISTQQKIDVRNEIAIAFADHKYFADYSQLLVEFFGNVRKKVT